jgi:hypothetical protein
MAETAEQRKEKHRRGNLQKLQKLRPIDDNFMRCIFKDNKPLTQRVLRILLQNENLNVVSVETQADMKRLVGARSICLDVLGVDDQGKKYDIEVQRVDGGASARRARYHSSVLDVESLDAGEDFDALPETYVIFITENDLFGKGLPFYHIQRTNVELGESFDDGTHILYVNGAYRGEDEIGRLMHDFSCHDPNDMLNEDLAKVSRYYKETQEGVEAMCKIMEDLCRETAEEIAENLINMGTLSFEDIAKATGLSLSEVQRLAENKTA